MKNETISPFTCNMSLVCGICFRPNLLFLGQLLELVKNYDNMREIFHFAVRKI